MNLRGLLLPDFSARVCGGSISARLFNCQGRVDFSLVARAPAHATAAVALEYPFVHHWSLAGILRRSRAPRAL